MNTEQILGYVKEHQANSANFDRYPELVFKSAGLFIPQLIDLVATCGKHRMKIKQNTEFVSQQHQRLQKLLDSNGSDKAFRHGYHLFYCYMFEALGLSRELGVFEIGLGTNNPALVSTMGARGRPGASLRAFRDFLPNARIYGADVDRDILFEEERIKTAYVDQLDRTTFDQTGFSDQQFDVIIDDGLHSIGANLNTLLFGLQRVKPGGWVVVEDIRKNLVETWNVVDQLLSLNPQYQTCMVECPKQCLYVVHRNKQIFG